MIFGYLFRSCDEAPDRFALEYLLGTSSLLLLEDEDDEEAGDDP